MTSTPTPQSDTDDGAAQYEEAWWEVTMHAYWNVTAVRKAVAAAARAHDVPTAMRRRLRTEVEESWQATKRDATLDGERGPWSP